MAVKDTRRRIPLISATKEKVDGRLSLAVNQDNHVNHDHDHDHYPYDYNRTDIGFFFFQVF